MSNFKCEYCGIDILDSDGGDYITECEHYPFEKTNNHRKIKERNIYTRIIEMVVNKNE